jgi:hypothetical protein
LAFSLLFHTHLRFTPNSASTTAPRHARISLLLFLLTSETATRQARISFLLFLLASETATRQARLSFSFYYFEKMKEVDTGKIRHNVYSSTRDGYTE